MPTPTPPTPPDSAPPPAPEAAESATPAAPEPIESAAAPAAESTPVAAKAAATPAAESTPAESAAKPAKSAAPRKRSARKPASKPVPAIYGTGRRKAAKSRVFMRKGKGVFTVNGKPVDEFFTRISSRIIARQALQVAGCDGVFDLYVTVRGGGENGQAEAVRHGVARALMIDNPDCKPELRKAGLVTRDSRAVERKKVGLRKARRAKQYSKR